MNDSDPFDGDEDAALRYAIELSLKETGDAPEKPIALDSDSDDDDNLAKKTPYTEIFDAVEKEATAESRKRKQKPEVHVQHQPVTAPAAASGLAALGLDRKKMEEERLARLGKRKAPDSDHDDSGRGSQRPKLDGRSSRIAVSRPSSSQQSVDNIRAAKLPYPKGVVKKTWALGYPRKDDIKIEEVLQKNDLELAVVSSFQWDEEWMLSKIDISRTRMVCIAFASSEAQQQEMKDNVPPGRIKFCFPPMMPAGTMHSKLQLLKYPKYLRVVIPTGNLVPYDWGETGVMENMVFLIDLPRIENPTARETNKLTAFGEELCYFLRAQTLDESLVRSLTNYDFSETSPYRFVHTIGQSHMGSNWQRTGYCGLGRAVSSLGLDTVGDIEVDYAVSSLGSVNMDLISAMYYAAQGDNGSKEYEKRISKGGKKKESIDVSKFKDKFRIYFPSQETVRKSRGGKNAAGTICAQSKWWNAATFPRDLIHECQSVRPGMLMHNKVMFVRHLDANPAWGYVGSANLSESAWGRLVKDRATGNPKLTCRNWECGVLVPVNTPGNMEEQTRASGLSAFQDIIPLPMMIPNESYTSNPSKRPWLFMEG